MTMQETAAQRNARFEAMTPAEKRVTIARDVIVRVEARKIQVQKGVYLQLPEDWIMPTEVKCTACALGAVFACAVDYDQRLTLGFTSDSALRADLSPYFEKLQLHLIEAAFEEQTEFYTNQFDEFIDDDYEVENPEWPAICELANRAVAFGGRTALDDRRLINIMSNIITNDGTFAP